MRYFIILFSVLIMAGCTAPDGIHVPFASWHHDREKDYQEFNPGVGVEWEKETLSQGIGTYYNSNRDQVYYYSLARKAYLNEHSYAYASVLLLHGYSDTFPIMPAPAIGVGIGDKVQLRTSYLPGVVAGFSVYVRLSD